MHFYFTIIIHLTKLSLDDSSFLVLPLLPASDSFSLKLDITLQCFNYKKQPN